MASNSRKAPQRWPPKTTDDRNRTSRVPQTGGSLHGKRRLDIRKIQVTLEDMFANVFDPEIIRSVAHSCGWKLNKSIETLIMLSEGCEDLDMDIASNSVENSIQSPLAAKCKSAERNLGSSKQKCTKDNTNKGAMGTISGANTILYKNKTMHLNKSKSVMMNASQGTIKVTYRGHDDPDTSDDDADVVIEEENEFESNGLDLGFSNTSTQSMWQFLTPFMSPMQHGANYMSYSLAATGNEVGSSSASTRTQVKSKKNSAIASPSGVDILATKTGKKTKHWPKFERIKRQINEGIKVMILMRGCPGSGKTSLARHIIKATYGENYHKYVFSADQYFVSAGTKKYVFDPKSLPDAHQWNKNRVNAEARKGTNPIIVDNTNLEAWEMKPYMKIAVQCGYNVEFLEPRTSWNNNAYELERKNVHNVSRKKIEEMLVRFDRDVTPAMLLLQFNLKYEPHRAPPQYTSQEKPKPKGKNDSSITGTKKKAKIKKKDEGKLSKKGSKAYLQLKKNDSSEQKQIFQVSDNEPDRHAVKTQVSCSITSLTSKEGLDNASAGANHQESNIRSLLGSSTVFKFNFTPPDEDGDAERSNKSREPLGSGSEDIDYVTDSCENSEDEMEVAGATDEWEDESMEDDVEYDGTLETDSCNEAVDVESAEELETVHCLEYALVLDDGTLLPQKSHTCENHGSAPQEEGRVWEYLLMTDNSKLLFHPKENVISDETENTREAKCKHDEKDDNKELEVDEQEDHKLEETSEKQDGDEREEVGEEMKDARLEKESDSQTFKLAGDKQTQNIIQSDKQEYDASENADYLDKQEDNKREETSCQDGRPENDAEEKGGFQSDEQNKNEETALCQADKEQDEDRKASCLPLSDETRVEESAKVEEEFCELNFSMTEAEKNEKAFVQTSLIDNQSTECTPFPPISSSESSEYIFQEIKCKENATLPTTADRNLDLLDLTENACLLNVNIAFAGVDDSASSNESPSLPQNFDNNESNIVLESGDPWRCSVVNSSQSKTSQGEMDMPILDMTCITNKENVSVVQDVNEGKEIPKNVMLTSGTPDKTPEMTNNEEEKRSTVISEDEVVTEVHASSVSECVNLSLKADERKDKSIESIDLVSLITQIEKKETTDHVKKEEVVSDIPCMSEAELHECKLTDKDILEKWQEGSSWDEKENTSSDDKANTATSTPKPARNNKRSITAEFSPEKISVRKDDDITVKEQSVCEEWSEVEEPKLTWETNSNNSEGNDKKSKEETEPQPQRDIFATVSNKQQDIVDAFSQEQKREQAGSVSNKALAGNEESSSPVHSLAVTNDLPSTSTSHIENTELQPPKNTDTSTNTHHSDFILLRNVNTGSEIRMPGIKIVSTFGRNIVASEGLPTNVQDPRKVGKVLTLDKSSMTYDPVNFSPEMENIKQQLEELAVMFPNYCVEDLQEIYENCNRDINWTAEFLMESDTQGIRISTPNSSRWSEPQTGTLVDLQPSSVSDIIVQEHVDNSQIAREDATAVDDMMAASCSVNLIPPMLQEAMGKSLSPYRRNGKKDRNGSISENNLLLKKRFEDRIVINDEYYSEHVSRIRKLRHGEPVDASEASAVYCADDGSQQNVWDLPPEEMSQAERDKHFFESSHILRPDAPEWRLHEVDLHDASPEEEEGEAVPLKFDANFAEQLHNLFGTVSLPFRQDVQRTLNLPMSLARQLHYFLMEAEQNTYDLMMQEDEELARKLQQQEEDATNSEATTSAGNQVPDLREIMDMEMALALYSAEETRNSRENKDDLATKLTKNLLCEWFPSLPKDVLLNVFEAHNNSFEETLEILLASTEEDNSVRTVMTPEARAAHEQALLRKASLENEKGKDNLQTCTVDKLDVTKEQAFDDADYYRSEASRHYELRNECQQKAQKAYKRGLTAVASYYSQMASAHKKRIEENNAKAASSLLLAHSMGNLSSTLDLHFLYVVEARQVLDMFLDHHIHRLLESGQRSKLLFINTGRGVHSRGGRPRIKPKVIERLEERGLRHVEVNPGYIQVYITRNATSSTRIAS